MALDRDILTTEADLALELLLAAKERMGDQQHVWSLLDLHEIVRPALGNQTVQSLSRLQGAGILGHRSYLDGCDRRRVVHYLNQDALLALRQRPRPDHRYRLSAVAT